MRCEPIRLFKHNEAWLVTIDAHTSGQMTQDKALVKMPTIIQLIIIFFWDLMSYDENLLTNSGVIQKGQVSFRPSDFLKKTKQKKLNGIAASGLNANHMENMC